jgi:hypothetical protein
MAARCAAWLGGSRFGYTARASSRRAGVRPDFCVHEVATDLLNHSRDFCISVSLLCRVSIPAREVRQSPFLPIPLASCVRCGQPLVVHQRCTGPAFPEGIAIDPGGLGLGNLSRSASGQRIALPAFPVAGRTHRRRISWISHGPGVMTMEAIHLWRFPGALTRRTGLCEIRHRVHPPLEA